MEHKPKNETWFEFMDRAKRNGLSPTKQEEVDGDRDKFIKAIHEYRLEKLESEGRPLSNLLKKLEMEDKDDN